MEQEMFTPRDLSSDEAASLGERYHLSEPVAVYKIAYNLEDVYRYRNNRLFLSCVVAYLIMITISVYYDLFFGSSFVHHSTTSFLFLSQMFNIIIIIYTNSLRRKWGNWPLIGPRDRQLRVYVYPEGIVKQTDRRSDVVRWSDIASLTYQPFQPGSGQVPNATRGVNKNQNVNTAKKAGIELKLHHGRRITINGALFNIDELARRLKYAYDEQSESARIR